MRVQIVDCLGDAFDVPLFQGVGQAAVIFSEAAVVDGVRGDFVAEFRVVPEYHEAYEFVLPFREVFGERLHVPVILVVRVFHAVFLFATVHEYAPFLVVCVPDYKTYPCLLFYDEDSFLRDGEEVDLLHAVAAFHVHVAEYDAAAYAADDACGVPFSNVPDDFVLEDVA